jgi:MFS family permease
MVMVTNLTALLNRAGYPLMFILPWLLPAEIQVWVLPAIVVGMALPGVVLAISFNAMFADVVPPEWRATVVGRRTALLAISSTVVSLACGQLLDRVVYPLNYQIVFLFGTLGGLGSSYFLAQFHADDRPAPRVLGMLNDMARPHNLARLGSELRAGAATRFLTGASWRELLRLDLLRGNYGTLMGAYFVFYLFQYTSIPLQPIFWVEALSLTDNQIGIGNALFYVTLMLTSLVLGWLTRKLGTRWLLMIGATLYGLYPLLHGLAYDATLFYVASFTGGAVWAVAGGSLTNRLMDAIPPDDRPAHAALHNLALNLGILVGATFGPVLVGWTDLRTALLIAGSLRIGAGLLFGLIRA